MHRRPSLRNKKNSLDVTEKRPPTANKNAGCRVQVHSFELVTQQPTTSYSKTTSFAGVTRNLRDRTRPATRRKRLPLRRWMVVCRPTCCVLSSDFRRIFNHHPMPSLLAMCKLPGTHIHTHTHTHGFTGLDPGQRRLIRTRTKDSNVQRRRSAGNTFPKGPAGCTLQGCWILAPEIPSSIYMRSEYACGTPRDIVQERQARSREEGVFLTNPTAESNPNKDRT